MSTRLAKLLLCCACLSLWQGCAKRPLTPLEQVEASFGEGKWQETVDGCSALLTEHPADLRLLSLRGQSYLALGRYEESITDFSLMIQHNPDEPEHYYLRQLAYQCAGDTALAEQDGIHGRSIDPIYKTAYQFDPSNFSPGLSDEVLKAIRQERKDIEDLDESEADDDQASSESNILAQSEDGRETDSGADLFGTGLNQRLPNAGEAVGDVAGGGAASLNPALGAFPAFDSPNLLTLPAEAAKSPKLSLDEHPDGEVPQNWLIQQRIASQNRQPARGPDEAPSNKSQPGDANPDALEPTVRPQTPLTTALPTTVNPLYLPSVPGVAAPRTVPVVGGYSGGLPAAAPTAQRVPTTGLDSRNLNVSNPISSTKPGVYQGNTLYAPGTKPTLSTSLPGTAPVAGPPAQPLGTQLPADRTVKAITPRPTGVIPRTPPK